MSANTPRYIIENHGPDQEAIKEAFAGAITVCAQLGISEITLLVSTKGTFPGTVVGTFLGDGVTKALCKGQTVRVADNLSMNLESEKTFTEHRSYQMVMGVYLSQDGQNLLDSVDAKAIVFLPWREDEGKKWLSTWNPTILGKSTWQVQQVTLPADVEESLLQLTQAINLSTGLAHHSDKKRAVKTLSEIGRRGHKVAPEDVRQWAVRHNWRPKDADDLAKLAARYFR